MVADVEPQLQHLAGGVPVDQLARRALRRDLAAVHDHQPVAQLLGLVHVVRGQDQRHALLLEPEQPVPHHVPGLRIQAGRRLVQEQDLGLVDQRPGDGEAALHAARQRLDLVIGPLGQLHEVQQPRRALGDDGPRQAEVPAVDQEVLPDGQLHVQGVLLRHDAEPGPDRRAVGHRVHAQDRQLAPARRRDAADHPHGRGLAGAVRAEEAERLTPPELEIDPVHGGEITEPLGQVVSANKDLRFRHARDTTRQGLSVPNEYLGQRG